MQPRCNIRNISSVCLRCSPEHASSVHSWLLPCQTTTLGNPTLLQVPLVGYRAAPPSPAAAMLFTGEDQTVSTALANNLFVQSALSPAAVAAPIANFQTQATQVALYTAFSVNWPPYTVAFCTSCCRVASQPPLPSPMNHMNMRPVLPSRLHSHREYIACCMAHQNSKCALSSASSYQCATLSSAYLILWPIPAVTWHQSLPCGVQTCNFVLG